MWFCLLDGGTSEGIKYSGGDGAEMSYFPGGVLLSAQSVSYFSNGWADYHQQFAVVSSDGKLYCSVVNEKAEIASNLEFNASTTLRSSMMAQPKPRGCAWMAKWSAVLKNRGFTVDGGGFPISKLAWTASPRAR